MLSLSVEGSACALNEQNAFFHHSARRCRIVGLVPNLVLFMKAGDSGGLIRVETASPGNEEAISCAARLGSLPPNGLRTPRAAALARAGRCAQQPLHGSHRAYSCMCPPGATAADPSWSSRSMRLLRLDTFVAKETFSIRMKFVQLLGCSSFPKWVTEQPLHG